MTKMDRKINKRIRETIVVTQFSKKVQKKSLQGYRHVKGKGREDDDDRKGESEGKPGRRWIEGVKEDLREKGLYGDEYVNRTECKRWARNVAPA